jgi:hypothetical protein
VAITDASKHAVQFYEDDQFLCGIVADFSHEGLEKGEAVILVATAPHRREVERRLTERGIDVGGLQESGQLVLLDARQTLETFMVDGTMDRDLFLSKLRSVMEAATAGWHRALRVYGEMVDLLWGEENHGAAIALEETWNAYAKTSSTRVLCGYAMNDAPELARVRELHTDVLPAEGEPPEAAGAGIK